MSIVNDNMLITHVKNYIRDGFVVMPVINRQVGDSTEKKPLLSEWQKLTLNDTKKILRGFTNPRVNAIGLLTGRVNGIFVLDVDPGADLNAKELPLTSCVKTGRGMHYYYQYEAGLGNSVNKEANLDTRGDGGFVVVPPSWHHKNTYEWVVELDKEILAPIPKWVKEMAGESKQPFHKFAFGTSNGNRNHSAAQVVGHVVSKLHEDLWEDFAWHGLRQWNKRNSPPLDEKELYKVFISIASREKMRRDAYKK